MRPAVVARNRCNTFQSAPADCRRENAGLGVRFAGLDGFQSAPADCRRENGIAGRLPTRATRFNPLPPTVGGRMSSAASLATRAAGFQSAPADCRRENDAPTLPYEAFQSAPADCRRENAHASRRAVRCFNPLPPTVGGRMLACERTSAMPVFQSAPADCRRENAGFRAAACRCEIVSIRSRRLSAGE